MESVSALDLILDRARRDPRAIAFAEATEPRTLRAKPTDLEVMSVEALNEYIAELEAEIERIRAAIEGKQSWRGEAESFFKK